MQTLNISPETLNKPNNGWVRPTPLEVRALIVYLGAQQGKEKLTGSEIANIVGADPRSIRRWTAPVDSSNSKNIPYAAWRLLLLSAGLVDVV